jgi:hypothetical protein
MQSSDGRLALHARAQAAVAAVEEEYGDAVLLLAAEMRLGWRGVGSEAELGVVLLLTAASEEAATLDVDPKLSGGEAEEIWRPDAGGRAVLHCCSHSDQVRLKQELKHRLAAVMRNGCARERKELGGNFSGKEKRGIFLVGISDLGFG